jgi:signal transduction histidine kinase/CheY-like chemotaxis protein
MLSTYDPALILLSIGVSAFGVFTAFSLAERIRHAAAPIGIVWAIVAAIAMGGGIGSAQIIATLGSHRGTLGHDGITTMLLSLLLGAVLTGLAISIVAVRSARPIALGIGGAVTGLSIAATQCGLDLSSLAAAIADEPFFCGGPIVLAALASTVALWLAFDPTSLGGKPIAAFVMAGAVFALRDTGIDAAAYQAIAPDGGIASLSSDHIAAAVGVVALLALVPALVAAVADRRSAARTEAEEARRRVVDRQLQREIDKREEAENALQEARELLEARVEERTRALLRAKETAEQDGLAKSRFLADMSRDLRTPLNTIIGYSDMLIEDAEAEGLDVQAEDLGKIRAAAKDLLALVGDVLDLAMVEAGRMELSIERFDLAPFIADLVATCRPLVAKAGNELDIHCSADLGAMRGDAARLRQVALNLLDNVTKTTRRGCISIAARREPATAGDSIVLTVRGFFPEAAAALLRRKGPDGASGSAGLGLALARQLSRLMGGTLAVENVPGKDSVFTLRVPAESLAHDASARDAEGATPPADPARARREIALVIDDDSAARELMQRILAKDAYETVAAANAQEGLRLARSLKPDVIALGVLQPDTSGWEALRILRGDQAFDGCPVLMLNMSDDKRMGFTPGAAPRFGTPFARAATPMPARPSAAVPPTFVGTDALKEAVNA